MQATPLRQYHPSLTGLRGFAALLVLCYHYFDGLKIFRSGWLGVDILFVLSGFLITGRLLENQEKGSGWFFGRRLLRIAPIYLLTLAVYFWILPLLATPGVRLDIAQNRADSGWYFSFLQNWLFVHDGYPQVPHLAYLWSLGIQVQFYLLMAFLTGCSSRTKPLVLICTVMGLISLVLRMNIRFETEGAGFTHYMYNSFTRLDSFMLGALAYLWLRRARKNPKGPAWLSIAAAVALVVLFAMRNTANFTDVAVSTLGLSLAAVAAAALLPLLVTGGPNLLNRVFSWKPLVFAGTISYGLFMYHVLVFAFASGRIYSLLAKVTGAGVFTESLSALVCAAITCFMAMASYRFIEKPLLTLKNKSLF